MSGGSKKEREERALDALLVSALRREEREGDQIDPKRLPKLTDEERAAMNSLGADFVRRLLAGQRPVRQQGPESDLSKEEDGDSNEAALAGSGAGCGLNRAEVIDEETAEELERRKREILERKKREREEGGGGGA